MARPGDCQPGRNPERVPVSPLLTAGRLGVGKRASSHVRCQEGDRVCLGFTRSQALFAVPGALPLAQPRHNRG